MSHELNDTDYSKVWPKDRWLLTGAVILLKINAGNSKSHGAIHPLPQHIETLIE